MKKPQIIMVTVAVVSFALAAWIINGMVTKEPEEKTVEVLVDKEEVLVARTDIGLGQVATDKEFRWQAWPKEAVTPGFITQASNPRAMSQFSGTIARSPIMAGEPITPMKLIKAGQGGVLAAILPEGMRAISTKIKDETAVGRLILPNDRVDVILTRRMRSKSGSEDFVSDTLFFNVRVLAIGQQIETKEGKKTAEGTATTATLELTPRQSELLALANAMGEISLALRSVADLSLETGPTNNELQKQRSNAIRVLRYGVRSRAYGVN